MIRSVTNCMERSHFVYGNMLEPCRPYGYIILQNLTDGAVFLTKEGWNEHEEYPNRYNGACRSGCG